MLPIDAWLEIPRSNPQARLRLFCFPYAGGGAGVYRGWAAQVPAAFEVVSIRLPGREARWRERPFHQLAPLLDELDRQITPFLDRPFVFFGHSMGAIVAYELCRRLEGGGRAGPQHLFVSGRRAPFLPLERKRLHDLPEPEFRDELRKLGGTPREVLENCEMMDLLSPMLRADLAVVETYEHAPGRPLSCPITALCGLDDPEAPAEKMEGWRTMTAAGFQSRSFPGNHFFIHSAEDRVMRSLASDLQSIADRAAPPIGWLVAAELPPLGQSDVHVWAANLERRGQFLEALRPTLSRDEQERAARFYFERDRNHFTAGRGILRSLLARYAACPPEHLQFQYGPEGKPFLASPALDLHFNVAHSHGLALFAFSRGRSVGVDVEYVRSDFDAEELAANFFSPYEVQSLKSTPEFDRREAFFRCWSRKEAYIKAVGKGLAIPLDSFDVSLEKNCGNALIETRPDRDNARKWLVRDIQPAARFAAAVAVAGTDVHLCTAAVKPA